MYFATAGVYEWGGRCRGFALVFLLIFQVCLENMGTTLEEFPPYNMMMNISQANKFNWLAAIWADYKEFDH